MAIEGYTTPLDEQAQILRAKGIPEEVITQLLTLGVGDPSAYSKQYEQSAYLRRAATSPEFAKSAPGAVAQGLAGFMAGRMDKDYGRMVRDYQGKQAAGRRSWWDTYQQKFGVQEPKPYDENRWEY